MLDLNIVHVKEFYETPLGKKVASVLARQTRGFLAEAKDEAVLAIGYPLPLIDPIIKSRNNLMVLMPATMGALYWPQGDDNLVVMSHDGELPLRESSVHRVIALHALEHSESLPHMMGELSQALTPMGKVLFLVPNRLSFWSHSSKTPFGYGKPFSFLQIKALLDQYGLAFLRARSCLFLPPGHSRPMVRLLKYFEWIGRFLLPFAGGVLMIEAQKQVLAGVAQPIRRLRPVHVSSGSVATPTTKDASCS